MHVQVLTANVKQSDIQVVTLVTDAIA